MFATHMPSTLYLIPRTQSPVLVAVNGAFAGLVSIRAFGAQAMFTEQSEDKINRYTQVTMVFFHVNRWVALRIQVRLTFR
jgi:hypothetical protein